jgi:hypothetical protein
MKILRGRHHDSPRIDSGKRIKFTVKNLKKSFVERLWNAVAAEHLLEEFKKIFSAPPARVQARPRRHPPRLGGAGESGGGNSLQNTIKHGTGGSGGSRCRGW